MGGAGSLTKTLVDWIFEFPQRHISHVYSAHSAHKNIKSETRLSQRTIDFTKAYINQIVTILVNILPVFPCFMRLIPTAATHSGVREAAWEVLHSFSFSIVKRLDV